MSDQETITTVVVEPPQQINFLKSSPSEFQKQLKMLDKVNKQAIEQLTEIMTDPEQDVKTRLKCIEIATSLYDSAAKAAANDNLQRLVAQARMGQQSNSKQLVNADEKESRPKPIIDFGTVRNLD